MIRVAEQILDIFITLHDMDIWHRYKYGTLIPFAFLSLNLFL